MDRGDCPRDADHSGRFSAGGTPPGDTGEGLETRWVVVTRGYYWHRVGWGCCQTPYYNTQDSPTQLRAIQPEMSIVLRLRNPGPQSILVWRLKLGS